MAIVVNVAPNTAIPRRIDGIVSVSKGTVTIEYKEKGQVKTKTKSFPETDLIAYEAGSPGFVIELSTDSVATLVGSKSLYVNPNATLMGAIITRTIVDDDSREARQAERAARSKVKVPTERRVAKKKGDKVRSKETSKKRKKSRE